MKSNYFSYIYTQIIKDNMIATRKILIPPYVRPSRMKKLEKALRELHEKDRRKQKSVKNHGVLNELNGQS